MRLEDHMDRMLDQALEATFPASDPISLYLPETGTADETTDLRE